MVLTAALLAAFAGCSNDAAQQQSETERTERVTTEQTERIRTEQVTETEKAQETGATRKVKLDGSALETFATAIPLPKETTVTETTKAAETSVPAVETHPDFNDAAEIRYALENSKTRFVNFAYPEFGADQKNADAINEIIREFSEELIKKHTSVSTWTTKDEAPVFDLTWDAAAPSSDESDALVNFDVEYTITRLDESYISIVFEGDYYMGRAAYPFGIAQGLIIDVQAARAVTLADLYTVDDAFTQQVRSVSDRKSKEILSKKLGISEDMVPNDALHTTDLQKSLTEANTAAGTNVSVFMFTDELGIILPLNHAMGDYYWLTVPFDTLEAYAVDTH